MEVKVENNQIEVKFSLQSGYRFKRAFLEVVILDKEKGHPVKISHESKAFSDFDFHKDKSLIQNNFIFYLGTPSGTWYNFHSLEDLYQFIGGIYTNDKFCEELMNSVKKSSEFTDEELSS